MMLIEKNNGAIAGVIARWLAVCRAPGWEMSGPTAVLKPLHRLRKLAPFGQPQLKTASVRSSVSPQSRGAHIAPAYYTALAAPAEWLQPIDQPLATASSPRRRWVWDR